jgi:hypothetical protein
VVKSEAITLVIALGDPEDRRQAEEAVAEARLHNQVEILDDGDALLSYVRDRCRPMQAGQSPAPFLIMLDPGLGCGGGDTVLTQLENGQVHPRIPIIVIADGEPPTDAPDAGYPRMAKPIRSAGLIQAILASGRHSFEIVSA